MNSSSETPETFEDLYENGPSGQLSMQQDGRIVRINNTLTTWLGYETGELLGRQFQSLLSVGTRIFYETHTAPLLHMTGSFAEVSLDLRTKSGEQLPVFANACVSGGAGGQIVRLVLVRSMERRRYEREIVEARRQSEALEAATSNLLRAERETALMREQFIAVLGHDLRNPLAAIFGGIRLLGKDILSDRSRLVLNMLQGSATRMSGLIDNVLDFARGRLGGGLSLAREEVSDLASVLRHVIDELRVDIGDRKIETDIAITRTVECDPNRIAQLASNLVANALTHGSPDRPVRVEASTVAGTLVLSVANGGQCLTPEMMTRLFQPFARGDLRSSKQGLGLGLHIVSEIAKAHGGTVNVASSDEETRFTFKMPLTG